MERVDIGEWVLEVDVDATRRAHEAIMAGAAEQCGCLYCRNFIAARSAIFDDTVNAVLSRFGILSDRESDVYDAPSLHDDGLCRYHGWFHAIGRVVHDPWVDGDKPCEPIHSCSSRVTLCFSPSDGLSPAPFDGTDTIQIQFFAEAPWVLADQAPPAGAPRTWDGKERRPPRSTVPERGTVDTKANESAD